MLSCAPAAPFTTLSTLTRLLIWATLARCFHYEELNMVARSRRLALTLALVLSTGGSVLGAAAGAQANK